MSGINKYCFDTNILIGLFSGQLKSDDLEAEEIIISIISEIEYLSFSNLKAQEIDRFNEFKNLAEVIGIHKDSEELTQKIIQLRKEHRLKTPDAIIAATALVHNATLITNDKGFSKVKALKIKHVK